MYDLNLLKQMGMSMRMSAQKTELTDEEALSVKSLQKPWMVGETVSEGNRRLYKDKLYKCRQGHTTQTGWEPDIYTAGWELIDETHAGTQEDPIPYGTGMTLEEGKYYTEEDILYLCTIGSGQAVYNKLSDLLGIYVSVVEPE